MTYKKKTWVQKLGDKKGLPKVMELEERFPCYNAVHKMGAEPGDPVVLVNPSEVVAVMKDVPEGKLITIVEICKSIAKNHGVKACCSLTTGIFIMTAANAVEEGIQDGGTDGKGYSSCGGSRLFHDSRAPSIRRPRIL